MDSVIERRESFRMPFSVEVICHVDDPGRKCSGKLRDLSISSLFMETDDCPHVDSKCTVDIILHGNHSSLKIEKVRGTVKRCDSDGVAVYFDERLEWLAVVPLYSRQNTGQSA
jgi:hypothetical protein